MRYITYIHKEHDTGFGISFPDFPGCIAGADSADEALQVGSEALAQHVAGMRSDGDEIPCARTLDAIQHDPEEQDALLDATIAYVVLIEDMGSPKRINITLDPGLLAAIDHEAKARKVTRSAFLASAARHEIEG